jgi:enterochelin esterase-like enzyme
MRRVLELAQRIRAEPTRADAILRQFQAEETFPLLDGDTATFFFWDGADPPSAVYLRHWVFGLESRQPFLQLEDMPVFYLPLELPHAARVEYKLEVERPRGSQWMRDPLNPRRAFDPFGSNSVCPMPGYRDPGWARPDGSARKGTMDTLRVRSRVYGDIREVPVYLPAEYKDYKRYPLLICHDGADYLRFTGIRDILDNLIHRHEVAPLVVAFTSGVARNEEYGANPKQPQWLVDELLPALRSCYAVPESEHLGLMGASFGGVASLYTAWSRPGVFDRLLLQSGSFVFTDIGGHGRGPLFDPVVEFANAFRAQPGALDARIYMSCGVFESLIYYNRSLVPLLRDRGLQVRFDESHDGHNWIGWRDRLREGLTYLYPGHLWMIYE